MKKIILAAFGVAAVLEVLRLLHVVGGPALLPLTFAALGLMLTLLSIIGDSERKS